jgi:hypothetical protein
MATLHAFDAAGYAFLEGGFPYSQGVVARPGYRLVRARFARGLTVAQGFEAIAAHLAAVGRPLHALCAVELRSPAPFSFEGFHAFNVPYVDTLRAWGAVFGGLNPVARSNVCPRFDPPAEPQFHAFGYTEPDDAAQPGQPPDFIVAGSGEWPEGTPFPDRIVARGDLSPAGLARKAAFVLQTMHERVAGLGADWSRLTAAQIYTVHELHPLLATHFSPEGLTRIGLTWQVCSPPIAELEFEMDVRSVRRERVLD